MGQVITKLPWRKPKVRVLEWPTMIGPLHAFVVIIKDGREYTFRGIPTVIVTNYKFDPPALISAIILWRGLLHVFSSRDVELRARHDEAMQSALRGRHIGKALSQIKGQDFGGVGIDAVDEERGSQLWWAVER